ncbi:3-oxoacyl-ACP reductase [Terribacillus saccharophilus]|uniref:SDR family NAD(P)-dependent oxidoreductase n=1 Tax=Terribacillus saccharophilus TaxID=361277 RepID=UPI000BA54759|nr:SDR family NAD(P)-dependent oxidoreductase [Terribacillus saccharophilus]PAF34666.1 3-oxoacyl-ACP reductase [Terribacillus saccharophilus]
MFIFKTCIRFTYNIGGIILSFHNKVVVVTGATKGIGREIALTFARHGASLIVNGRNRERLAALQNDIQNEGSTCSIVSGDASSPETVNQIKEIINAKFQRVNILVNNAGMNTRTPTLQTTLNDWENVIRTNLTSAFLTSQSVLPFMIENKQGVIINISSTTANTPHKNATPAYGASKAALNYLTMHLAYEMACHNIRVNAICPGPIETDMTEQWDDTYREKVINGVPLKRLGDTSDVAEMALFLASDQATFITGQSIHVNGGTLMR